MKYSVIIPVYNCESYIKSCLNSILNTTFNDFEIICIDDGSIDNTKNEILSINDPRLIYIYQENKGVSSARNKGIRLAKGKYILFIDADDTIKNNYFDILNESIKDESIDILYFGYEVNGISNRKNDFELLNNIKQDEILPHLLNEANSIYGYVWRATFKKELLINNDLLFLDNIKISEDFLFLFLATLKAKNIKISKNKIYEYRINENSVTTKYIKSLKENMEMINDLILENIKDSIELNEVFNSMILNTLIRIIQNNVRYFDYLSSLKLANESIKNSRYKGLIKDVFKFKKYMSKKNFISILFFKFKFTWLYILIFKIKNKLWLKNKI